MVFSDVLFIGCNSVCFWLQLATILQNSATEGGDFVVGSGEGDAIFVVGSGEGDAIFVLGGGEGDVIFVVGCDKAVAGEDGVVPIIYIDFLVDGFINTEEDLIEAGLMSDEALKKDALDFARILVRDEITAIFVVGRCEIVVL